MTSGQKYEGKGNHANPTRVNGSQAEQTANSPISTVTTDQPADKAPPAWITPPALTLMYGSAGPADSDAMLLFRALSAYRDGRVKWLVKYVLASGGDPQDSDSGLALSELVTVDQLIADLVEGFQLSLDYLAERMRYAENPGTYVGQDTHNEETRNQWATDLTRFLS